jgi:predicted DNA-binding transcriptional regulator YafY
VPKRSQSRVEPDLDALLEAQGFVARPGPRPKPDEAVSQAIAHAIKGCLVLDILYRSHQDTEHMPRHVMPYGVLTGLRRYLVARPVDDPNGPVRCYRLDAVKTASVTNTGFSRPEGFDLQAFANRAFGVYQRPEEIGEVVWRFVPAAAEHARGFQFHPDQVMEDQPDGSLVVRFTAAGHLEMAWHLYTWGDKVEVLAPPALRAMVDGHRRSDFPAMP